MDAAATPGDAGFLIFGVLGCFATVAVPILFIFCLIMAIVRKSKGWTVATIVMEQGRATEVTAEQGEDFLIAMLDQDEGARSLGEIAIGTNYQVTEYTKNTLFDEKIGGTFHAAVGAGYPETGNDNQSGLHWDMVCDLRTGGTITVDGEVISRDGKFVFNGWPGN